MKLYKQLAASAFALFALSQGADAAAPSGYYSKCEGLYGKSLLSALNTVVGDPDVVGYDGLWSLYGSTDLRADGSVWDMYSTKSWKLKTNQCGNYKNVGDCYNREHSFPKSWFNEASPMKSDAFHVYPTDGKVNGQRSNHPYGECEGGTTLPGSGNVKALGRLGNSTFPGYSGTVFEPDDEYKGDFARTYFYMAAAYNTRIAGFSSPMLAGNSYPAYKDWAIELLLKWHRQDPVSSKETNRNDAVYAAQGNRNPFIDHPELAEYIWGNKVGQTFNGGSGSQQPTGDPNLVTPTNDMALEFSQVAIGRSTTAILQFRGENLTGNFELILSGSDKGMFSIPSTKLSTSLVNQPDGTQITVTYTPTAIGKHEASLIIVDGGITGSRIVRLIGECLEVPTLTACTATDPTDITNDSYRANWTYPANETVDYWVINRTRYVSGTATAEEVLAEAPGTIIEDFDQSDSESYSVQSVRLGYRSPASNVVFVAHAGITGVQADQGLVVQGFDGIMRFICSAEQTGACIYDISGKLVMFIDTIHNNMDIDIPAGIYLVTTDQCHTPVKVAVK